MPGLDDYGALLRSGQAAVPDYAADEAKRQFLSLQQMQQKRLMAEQQQEIAEQQGFQNDLTTVLAHPSAQGYSALIAKHPKFAQQVKSSWDLLDGAKQKADLQSMSEVYSAAANGKHDLAVALMKRRIDADKAAGQPPDEHDQAIMDALESGDPVQQKAALGMIGVTVSAITGPDKFEQTLGALTKDKGYTLAPGDVRFDESNNKVASVDARPDFLVVPEGGRAIPLNPAATAVGMGGGGPAFNGGGAPVAPPPTVSRSHGYTPRQRDGGDNPDNVVDSKIAALSRAVGVDPDAPMNPQQFASFVSALPATEGGPGTLSAKQNNPGAIKDGSFAKGQPGYAGGWKGYAVFKDAQSGQAAMQKLLTNRYYNRGQQSIRGIIEGKPTDRYYSQQPSGQQTSPSAQPSGIPGTVYGNPKPQARVLAPAEAQAKGLDTSKIYEQRPDGTVSAVGDAAGGGVGGPLNPKALETAAVSYIKTGKMPAGMGGQALKNQILNYVPQIMDRHGLTPDDMPSIQQQFTADSAAFKQRVGQLSYMRQSVGKLNQHAQDLSALIKAVPAQGSFKPFNWITQGVEGQFSNSTITQLQAGLPLFEAEVARVMTGNPASGAGQLSDNARHEFAVLSSPVAPSAKIDAVNRIMKMVEETVKSTRDETGTLKARIGGGIEVYAGKAPSESNTSRQPPQGATKTATGPNGQKAALVNGHWVQY